MLPLRGVRVLDVTTFLAGPLATRALADFGADVIKVEPPSGDPTRAGWTGLEGSSRLPEPNPYWRALHGGRRSIVLDLTAGEDRETFLRLAADADVVVDNMRPGVTARFGVDGPSLRALFPRLVTCAITGFDADDPLAGISATDGPVQAWTGAVELMKGWTGVAMPMPMQVGDVAGGSIAAQAILAALVARASTGVGTHIDISLAGALAQWMAVTDRHRTLAPPATLVLAGSDGVEFLVQAPLRFAAQLLAVFGLPTDLPRGDVAAAVHRVAVCETAATWLDRLWTAGVPAAPVRPPSDTLPTPPWSFDGERAAPASGPPALGAHNGQGWR
jgi:crotonobetainyl-CoA:carnitine CoA-transferase CaiB-like acyl-CoA transferase